MKTLNPYTLPLKGFHLIEASAGSGKTYTLSLLYLRLLIEHKLKPHQILFTTFTEAACKDIRIGLEKKIYTALNILNDKTQSHDEDQKFTEYLYQFKDNKDVKQHLQYTLEEINDAHIFTIHGFAHHVLKSEPFTMDVINTYELLTQENPHLRDITDSIWRKHISHLQNDSLNAYIAQLLIQNGYKNTTLFELVKLYITHPNINHIENSNTSFLKNLNDYIQLYNSVKKCYQKEKRFITREIIDNHQNLNQKIYKKTQVENMLSKLAHVFQSNDVFFAFDKSFFSLCFSKLTHYTKKNKETPRHLLFKKLDELYDSNSQLISHIPKILYTYATKSIQKWDNYKEEHNILTYHDLLGKVYNALKKHSLKKPYPEPIGSYKAVLLDEFQDTNTIQYNIFKNMYQHPKSDLFWCIVGDPKQAIYGFRGGDVYAYLQAKKDISKDNQYVMKYNYRSSVSLISRFNSFFSHPDLFVIPEISYTKVASGNIQKETILNSKVPLHITKLDIELRKSSTAIRKEVLANYVAKKINDLVKHKAINYHDIAIIVRHRNDINLMMEHLHNHNIPYTNIGSKSVLSSTTATELLIVLDAIVHTPKTSSIYNALYSPLLMAYYQNTSPKENIVHSTTKKMHELQNIYNKQGFITMFYRLMTTFNIDYLSSSQHSKRIMTDLYHLADILETHYTNYPKTLPELVRWFKEQLIDSQNDTENIIQSAQDNDTTVQVMTIHGSKGLEYPIVICPFMGEPLNYKLKERFFLYQQLDNNTYTKKIYFKDINPANHNSMVSIYKNEHLSEEVRLLYVALTRAKYYAHIPHIDYKNKNKSILHHALKYNPAYPTDTYQITNDILIKQNEPITTSTETAVNTINDKSRIKRTFSPEKRNKAYSFSSLNPLFSQFLEDEIYQDNLLLSTNTKSEPDPIPSNMYIGQCLHDIFEKIDYNLSIQSQKQHIYDITKQHHISTTYIPKFMQWIEQVAKTSLIPYMPNSQLEKIPKHKQWRELEFFFNLNYISVEKIYRIIYKGETAHDKMMSIEGIMHGFIDLVVQIDNAFFIVDYKSNAIPEQDYSQERVQKIMDSHQYTLQYYIYALALHRYLALKLGKNYSINKYLGGVTYLFVRGLKENHTEGIFYVKPNIKKVLALDNLFNS